jgi:hypothetical protein
VDRRTLFLQAGELSLDVAHEQIGEIVGEGAPDERPGATVDVDGNIDARLALESIERVRDLFDRLVRAVEGRAENGDDSDRVLLRRA